MKKKILFVCKDMNVGGVEKALLSLVNEMNPCDYEVDLILLEERGGFISLIPEWINVIILDEYLEIKDLVNDPPIKAIRKHFLKGELFFSVCLFYYYCKSKLPSGNLEQYYEKVFARIPATKTEYDVAIAFTSIINYLTWYVVYKVKADKKLGWIHFDVKKLSMDKHLLLHLHQQLDHIFIVSKQAENNFIELFPQLAPKCELMYNIVSDKMITEMAKEPVEELKYNDNEFVILTLGRLSHEKGQDLIPEIANKLRNDEVPFCWYLIGDGNLSTFVRNKIQELGLEGNVKLLGTKTNPYPYLKQADIFVQTSRHEGYCISLAEARALNLPIVTTDFSGAFDQIENEKNGLIVPFSVDELYGGVKRLLDNSELRDKFTKNLQSEKCDISEEMQKLYSFIEE